MRRVTIALFPSTLSTIALLVAFAAATACGNFLSEDSPPASPNATDSSSDDAATATNDDSSAAKDADLDAAKAIPKDGKVVFLTSAFFSPGKQQQTADSLCNIEANDAKLTHTFIAWQSKDGVPASNLLSATASWYLVSGELVGNKAALSSTLAHAIDVTAENIRITAAPFVVWTGTTHSGAPDGTCSSWTSDVVDGTAGDFRKVDAAWTDTDTATNCSTGGRLYCFEL